MPDPILLDVTKFSATYVRGSGVLQLRGDFKSSVPMRDVQFSKVFYGAGLAFEVRGKEREAALTKGSTKIADLDFPTTAIEKAGPGGKKTTVFLNTKSGDYAEYPIQFLDGSDPSTNKGTGDKGIQPPETLFLSWIDDATKAVKAKYPNPVLISADAARAPGAKQKDPLSFSADFRVQKINMVTVTGDGTTISSVSRATAGMADITDLTQLKLTPWDVVNTSNLQDYAAFTLLQYIGPPSVSGVPDQPYYEFRDSNQKRIVLFGASDGKKYFN